MLIFIGLKEMPPFLSVTSTDEMAGLSVMAKFKHESNSKWGTSEPERKSTCLADLTGMYGC